VGALAELGEDEPPVVEVGPGQILVDWWHAADEDDRAVFRSYLAEERTLEYIAGKLRQAGTRVSTKTLSYGIRRLERTEWAP
jgi:hypothetical protein